MAGLPHGAAPGAAPPPSGAPAPATLARRLLPYALIVLASVLLFVWIGVKMPAVRVGDGSEYYAMFYAWSEGWRPWMADAANSAYEALVASGKVGGMVPRDWFAAAFPALRVGETTDFNHFWFYSLLAVLCQKAALLVGLKLSIHASFLALHATLAAATAALAYRHHRWLGVAIVTVMVIGSPVAWFLDKVHTEAFTVFVVLMAMIQMGAQRYASASALIAMAATQNPSFALIAGVPWAYRVLLQWRQRYTAGEVLWLLAAAALVLVHPVYYELRYGVITPQLLAGGADMGTNLSSFYIWLIDPDLGLLPNWPLGALAVLLGAILWPWARRRPGYVGNRWHELLFFTVFMLANLYAHSSTGNINSGATPGLARYALWYLPALYPLMLWIGRQFPWGTRRGYALALLVVVGVGFSVQRYKPRRGEMSNRPSKLSSLVQSTPGLNRYNPPPELFMERYSGAGESRSFDIVVGPDCRKVLMIGSGAQPGVAMPRRCLFDADKLAALRVALYGDIGTYRYVRLSPEQVKQVLLTITDQPYRVGKDDRGRVVLGDGWDVPEGWGVWSVAPVATLNIPCNAAQFIKPDEPFNIALSVQPFGEQTLTIRDDHGVRWQGELKSGGPVLQVTVPAANCRAGLSRLSLQVSNLTSPAERGESGDTRKLGVSFYGFQVSKAR